MPNATLFVPVMFVAMFAVTSPHVAAQAGSAPAYPAKVIRLVVPYPAGAGTDLHARALAQKLTENLGQAVIVDNRGGANGTLAMEFVAKSAPDDLSLPGGTHAVFVRSPHAHSRIRSIDKRRALAMPGVITILTGKDLLADGLKPLPHKPQSTHPAELRLVNRDGSPVFDAPHYPLAVDKTRHVGEAVAVVIAQTVDLAKDGAEQVDVDYEILPSVTGTLAAVQPDAPLVRDEASSNVCLDAELGAQEATAAAFARATHIAKLDTWVQRVTGVPMEPRAAVGEYDAATQRYTLRAGSGGAVRLKHDLATVLDV